MRPAAETRQGLHLVLPEDQAGPKTEPTVEKARQVHGQRERAWTRYPAGERPACPACNEDLLPVPVEQVKLMDEDEMVVGVPVWNASWYCPGCHLIADHRGRDLRREP